MSELELVALRADTPLGFLAAVGALRLASEELALPRPRLGWPRGTKAPAVLSVDEELTLDELVDRLYALVADCRATGRLVPGLDGFPPWTGASGGTDPVKSLTFADGRGLSEQTWSDELMARWVPALVAPAAPEDGRLAVSQFLKVGPGTVWVERTLGGVIEHVTSADVLRGGLVRWQRTDNIGAYLDVRADMSAARAPEAKGTSPKHGEPAATWLALMALPLLPARATRAGRVTVGWRRDQGRWFFRYPVWRDGLGLASVRALLDHPSLQPPGGRLGRRERSELEALGVVSVMQSERLVAGKYNGPLAEAIDLLRQRIGP